MSLYNAIFGVNPLTPVLLLALNTEIAKIPRFRDAYLVEEEGVRHIVIYTRTGGGNRDYYDSAERNKNSRYGEDIYTGPFNDDLRALPGFLRDDDDMFDSTYAHFHYAVPEAFKSIIDTLVDMTGDKPTPREKWNTLLADLNAGKDNPDTARALEVGKSIMSKLFPS